MKRIPCQRTRHRTCCCCFDRYGFPPQLKKFKKNSVTANSFMSTFSGTSSLQQFAGAHNKFSFICFSTVITNQFFSDASQCIHKRPPFLWPNGSTGYGKLPERKSSNYSSSWKFKQVPCQKFNRHCHHYSNRYDFPILFTKYSYNIRTILNLHFQGPQVCKNVFVPTLVLEQILIYMLLHHHHKEMTSVWGNSFRA